MKKQSLVFILITLLFSCRTEKKSASQLITLSNGTIEIGILAEVGGRLVRVSLTGQQNILKADSAQWNESQEKRPNLDPNTPFKAYNGHITWLSPQSEWWTRQDSFPELKNSRSLWPPDPYLTQAPYQITAQNNSEITLISPKSPFTKVQFTKNYRIDGHTVHLSTIARNISSDTVSWGLWHNTRMNGWDAVFVQADSSALLKTEFMQQGEIRKPELSYKKGFFTYESMKPDSVPVYKSKSFFAVEKPLIAGFHQNQWLIVRSTSIDPSRIHPNESRVELYVENSVKPDNDLQELEIQFAYQKIAPGATIEASETWDILPGTGLTNKKELLEELLEKLNQFD